MLLNMKTKKVEKVMATLKDPLGHPLKRQLAEIPTQVNNLNSLNYFVLFNVISHGCIKFLSHSSILKDQLLGNKVSCLMAS